MQYRLSIKGSYSDAEAELQKRGLFAFARYISNSPREATYWNWEGEAGKLATWFCEVSAQEYEPGKGFPVGTLLFYKELE